MIAILEPRHNRGIPKPTFPPFPGEKLDAMKNIGSLLDKISSSEAIFLPIPLPRFYCKFVPFKTHPPILLITLPANSHLTQTQPSRQRRDSETA